MREVLKDPVPVLRHNLDEIICGMCSESKLRKFPHDLTLSYTIFYRGIEKVCYFFPEFSF